MKTLAALMSLAMLAAAPPAPQDDVAKKVTETYASAADWLVSQQAESGAWSMAAGEKSVPSPSFTGLIIASFGNAPEPLKAKYKPAADKAVDTNTEAKAKARALMNDRRMPALIWRRRRSVNRMVIDASHTTLLKVGSSESH